MSCHRAGCALRLPCMAGLPAMEVESHRKPHQLILVKGGTYVLLDLRRVVRVRVAKALRHPGEVGVDDDGASSEYVANVAVGCLAPNAWQLHEFFYRPRDVSKPGDLGRQGLHITRLALVEAKWVQDLLEGCDVSSCKRGGIRPGREQHWCDFVHIIIPCLCREHDRDQEAEVIPLIKEGK